MKQSNLPQKKKHFRAMNMTSHMDLKKMTRKK